MISCVSKYDFLQVVSCRYFDIIKFIFDIQYMFKFCLREFPARDREDSVELYHSLMYTTVFVEVYQCVCRSIPYSILQLIPTKLGGNQLQNTVWCMYGILLQTHWYSGIVLQIVV